MNFVQEYADQYAKKFAPVYTLILFGGYECTLTEKEVYTILAGADTELQGKGRAVYGVRAVIVAASKDTGWTRELWAYRVGDVWVYVPTRFKNVKLYWNNK